MSTVPADREYKAGGRTDLQVQATANDVTEVRKLGLDAQFDFTFESAFVLQQ